MLVGMGIVVAEPWDTYWGRAIRGVSRLKVENLSPHVLDDVTILAQDAGGRKHSSVAQRLQPGQTVRLDVRTSDLYLVSVTWNDQGTPKGFSEGGLACRGEVYVIELPEDGSARTHYER